MSLRKRISKSLRNYIDVDPGRVKLINQEVILIPSKCGSKSVVWEVFAARYPNKVLILCARREGEKRLQEIVIHRDMGHISPKDYRLLYELFKIQLQVIHSHDGH